MISGDSSRTWSASQDRAWQMLSIGPRWVRHSGNSAEPSDPSVSDPHYQNSPASAGADLERSVLFDQTVLTKAVQRGLGARAFQWTEQSAGSDAIHQRGLQKWLLISQIVEPMVSAMVSQTQSQLPAPAEQLLISMLGSIEATWAEPAPPGNSDSHAVSQILDWEQVGGVLVLGRNSLEALGHDSNRFEDLRGRHHRLLVNEKSIPVIVTFEPDRLLREPLDKAGAWRDLQLAKSLRSQGTC